MSRRHLKNSRATMLVLGLVLGALTIIGIRFANAKSDAVHYHANFALYVNGVHDEFKGPGYYEEVQTCTANAKDDPRARVHMHNQENHIIHVHDSAVTWSDFFASIGYTLGDKVLVTNQGVFTADSTKKLTFILNGKQVDTIAGRVIGNEDVLLVDFGSDDAATIQKDYDAIPKDAHKENMEKDPASCGGASTTLTFTERLKKSLEL